MAFILVPFVTVPEFPARCYTGGVDLTRVVFLGTGDAFSAGGRHQAAYLVESSETSFLLDCGPTALASLKRHGLAAEPIDSIFLSHLHGDHFAGLPFFFLEYMYIEPRQRPLRIVGPPGTEERVTGLYRNMYPDAAAEQLPFSLEFIEVRPEKRLSIDGVMVDPFRVPHLEQPISLAFEIRVGDRSILYSGDTGWTEDLVAHSQNVDLFICECSYFETRLPSHLDYPRLAENRARFGAERIVLTHLGQEVLRRKNEIDMELAYDGLVVTL